MLEELIVVIMFANIGVILDITLTYRQMFIFVNRGLKNISIIETNPMQKIFFGKKFTWWTATIQTILTCSFITGMILFLNWIAPSLILLIGGIILGAYTFLVATHLYNLKYYKLLKDDDKYWTMKMAQINYLEELEEMKKVKQCQKK